MLCMMRMRCRDIDELHTVILQHFLIASIIMLRAIRLRKRFCTRFFARCHRIQADIVHLPYCLRHRLRDAARS